MLIEIVQLDSKSIRINSDHIVYIERQDASTGLEEHTVIKLSTERVIRCLHKPEDIVAKTVAKIVIAETGG